MIYLHILYLIIFHEWIFTQSYAEVSSEYFCALNSKNIYIALYKVVLAKSPTITKLNLR